MGRSVLQVFKTNFTENRGKRMGISPPDRGKAADGRWEVSQPQHFCCLTTLWFGLVVAGNIPRV